MKHPLSCLLLALAMLPSLHAANANEFLVYNYYYRAETTTNLPGRLYVPTTYDPNQSYPLVVFFHGAGERGSNNTSQVNGNINNLFNHAKTRDFFLYAPQLPSSMGTWTNSPVERSYAMAAKVMQDYNIDRERFYVTGLSLGGGGIFEGLIRYRDGITAAVSVCAVSANQPGSPPYEGLAGKPIWQFHAENDGTVSPVNSRNRLNDIRADDGGKPAVVFPLDANPSNPYYNTGAPYYSDGSTYYEENNHRYSEYATGGHGIWHRVYNEEPMYDWLLAQVNPIAQGSLRPGESIYFDFGNSWDTSPDSTGRIWNTTAFGAHDNINTLFPFAQTENGRGTAVCLELTKAFAFHSGGNSTALYEQDIGTDGWSTVANDNGTILLTGLVPGNTYELELYGSTTSSNRMTRYQVSSNFGDLDTSGNASDVVNLTVVADSNGDISIDVVATPGSGATTAHINTLKLTAPSAASTALASWRTTHGIDAGGADDLATPAGDGVPNLLKFAFNLAANAGELNTPNHRRLAPGGSQGMPRLDKDASDYLTLTFVRRTSGSSGVTYAAQYCTDLAGGSWTNLSTTPTVTAIDSEWERVTYTDEAPASSGSPRYLRVSVSTN